MDENIIKQQELITRRISLAKSWTKPWHDNIQKWRNLYNFKHYTEEPKTGEIQFIDPTYTNTVDLAVGIFQTNSMTWDAIGWEPSQSELEKTSDAEKYLAAVVDNACDVNQYDIIYETYLQFTRDGGSVLYTVWDKEKAKKVEKHKVIRDGKTEDREFFVNIPVHTEVIDPLAINVLPGGPDRWLCVVHCRTMSLYDAERLAGGKSNVYKGLTFTDKLETQVELQDYWEVLSKNDIDSEYFVDTAAEEVTVDSSPRVVRHAILIDNELIRPIEIAKGYKDLPFDIGLYKPTSRNDTSMWHSIISPLIPVVTLFERGINRRQRMVDLFSSLPLVSKTASGRSIQMDPGIGNIINLTLDEAIQLPTWSGNPPDAQKQLDVLSTRIQQSGFPEMMYGSGADVQSGYALSQMSDQGRIRLNQPTVHMKRMWSWWAKKVLDLTAEFGGDREIQVYGQVRGENFMAFLDINDLTGIKISCNIDPDYPNEETRKHALAAQAKGTLSDRTLMERYYKILQPDDELQRKLMEQAASNPFVIQYEVLRQLRTRATEGDEVAALAMKAVEMQLSSALGGPSNATQAQSPGGLTGLQTTSGMPPAQVTSLGAPGMDTASAVNNMSNAFPQTSGGVE